MTKDTVDWRLAAAEAREALQITTRWSLTGGGWLHIQDLLDKAESAVAAGDATALQQVITELGLAGPRRVASKLGDLPGIAGKLGVSAPEPAPMFIRERVNVLIDRLLELRAWTLWCALELGAGSQSYQAVEIGEKLAADNERVYGVTNPKTLASKGNLASAYRMSGRPGKAVPLFERVVAEERRVLGDLHRKTLLSQNNLARAYPEAGRPDDAVPLLERVLSECEQVLGESHPETLFPLGTLAVAYQDAGRADEALALLERMAAACELVLGEEHPGTLAS